MLNKSAATDARHSRSGKDAMLYNSAGKPFAQVESFTTKGSFNNYKYAPLGQNRELEVNGTVGVTVNISERLKLQKTDYGRWKVNIAPPHISTPRFIAE